MKLTRFRLSLILTVIILITVGAVALRFIDDRRQRAPQAPAASAPEGASMALANVRQTSVKDGIKEWHLDAVSATLLESENKMILERLTVEFFMQNGETLNLTASEGVLDTATNDIEVSGSVVVRHQAYTLTGESFAYTHADQRLVSRTPVHIASDRMDLTADRMTVDLKTRQTELAGNVKGSINEAFSL